MLILNTYLNLKRITDFGIDIDIDIEGFFDWLTVVDRLFEYTEFLEDRKVKFVAYKLKARASLWWDRLKEMTMRKGQGPIQTWSRMKQLLRGRFFPSDYE